MMTLGVDPDTKGSGLGLLHRGTVEELQIVQAPSWAAMCYQLQRRVRRLCKLHDVDVLIVEGQQFYIGETKARPQDIIKLAQVAGAAMAGANEKVIVDCPLPCAWKGQTPKKIHQARMCERLDLDREAWPKITKKGWSEAVDAAGLALWGYQKWRLLRPKRG